MTTPLPSASLPTSFLWWRTSWQVQLGPGRKACKQVVAALGYAFARPTALSTSQASMTNQGCLWGRVVIATPVCRASIGQWVMFTCRQLGGTRITDD